MAKKPTRLRFTEDDLADSKVKKAADRAEKAADKAEKAVDKVSPKKKHQKLRSEADVSASRKAKLRFDKAKVDVDLDKPSKGKHLITRASAATVSSKVHQAVSEHEDDNVGIQAVHQSEEALETAAYTVDHAVYSKKLKAYDKANKLVEKSDAANVDALFEKFKKDNPDASSNPFSRWRQLRKSTQLPKLERALLVRLPLHQKVQKRRQKRPRSSRRNWLNLLLHIPR